MNDRAEPNQTDEPNHRAATAEAIRRIHIETVGAGYREEIADG